MKKVVTARGRCIRPVLRLAGPCGIFKHQTSTRQMGVQNRPGGAPVSMNDRRHA